MFLPRFLSVLGLVTGITLTAVCAQAQNTSQRLELERKGETIVLEPYAPNILRVTLSLQPESALASPGYGVVAAPDAAGWSASRTTQADVYRSSRMVVSVERDLPPTKPPLQTQLDIAKYFNGSTPGAHITFRTPGGRKAA
jgi:alpha-D-xyloside xylohydrolase